MNALLSVCALTVLVATQVEPDSEDVPSVFRNVPILETCETRIHVSKGGRWILTQKAVFHFEYLDSPNETELAREFADELWPARVDRGNSYRKGESFPRTQRSRWTVETFSKKSNDMALLVHVLKEKLQLPDCTFSWNKDVFEIQEVESKHGMGDSTGSILGDIVVGMVVDSLELQFEAYIEARLTEFAIKAASPTVVDLIDGWNHARDASRMAWYFFQEMSASRRVIVTTSGKLSSTKPTVVDPKGKSVTIDPALYGLWDYPHLRIRIEGLQSR